MVRQCLAEGISVEIDGLGTFLPDPRRGFRFQPRNRPKVFVAYVQEDAPAAERLFDGSGNLPASIPGSTGASSCPARTGRDPSKKPSILRISSWHASPHRSVKKKGGFQAEIRYALDCTQRIPLDEIFLIPARLDACPVPSRIQRELQYIDLFPDWERGVRRIVSRPCAAS